MKPPLAWLPMVCVLSACGHSSALVTAKQPPSDSAGKPAKNAPVPSCREALVHEAQLLAKGIRADVPASELAAGLEKFAAAPIVTRETVTKIAQVRTIAANVAQEDHAAKLKDAESKVSRACERIDTPEQQAQDAVDQAIAMLMANRYREMLERFTEPQELASMKKDGHFERVVQRFTDGWGDTLLKKLKLARTTVPILHDDGTVSFFIPGVQGPMSRPVKLVHLDGVWFFSE